PSVDLALAGVDIICNASGSHHVLGSRTFGSISSSSARRSRSVKNADAARTHQGNAHLLGAFQLAEVLLGTTVLRGLAESISAKEMQRPRWKCPTCEQLIEPTNRVIKAHKRAHLTR
ncbi:hypothetical protein AAVH_34421, partial [Aphelenchoides avenae]